MITALTIFLIWFIWTTSFTIVTVWILKMDNPKADVTPDDVLETWSEDMGGSVIIAYFLHPLFYLYPVYKWIVETANITIGNMNKKEKGTDETHN